MLNTRNETPNSKATGKSGGVAGVVLLTPAFFDQFPGVRFHFSGPGRPRETNPLIYKYGDGALEEEERR
jgi:hypothetical protein